MIRPTLRHWLTSGVMLAAVVGLTAITPSGAEEAPQVTAREGCRRAPLVEGDDWTRFGSSLSTVSLSFTESLAAEQRKFGRLRAVRIFDPALPPANAWSNRSAALGKRMVVTSFRMPPAEVLAGTYDAAIVRFFREAPLEGKVLWSYLHEPEPQILAGAFTAKQYRQAFRRLVDLATHACHRNLHPTLILTGWTADAASGRDWRDYYPGPRYISVLGWDPYNSEAPTSYESPRSIYGPVVQASRETNKPFGIAETGSVLIAGDDGTARAEWLQRVGRYLTRKQALFVTYFDSTRDGHYRLDDTPSIQAWRSWVQS
ncbi:MAG TPA: hypothetical protein VLI04_17955 [Nocardioidaceae bacterium]|nr:hypothetical protein [Nocardioidaceae bacterium]